jgi:hypothetical protein
VNHLTKVTKLAKENANREQDIFKSENGFLRRQQQQSGLLTNYTFFQFLQAEALLSFACPSLLVELCLCR